MAYSVNVNRLMHTGEEIIKTGIIKESNLELSDESFNKTFIAIAAAIEKAAKSCKFEVFVDDLSEYGIKWLELHEYEVNESEGRYCISWKGALDKDINDFGDKPSGWLT